MPALRRVPTGMSGNNRFGVMGDNACNAQAGGLFLHNYCPRMVLAVKGSFAMMKRIMPLTAPGHSLTTFSWEEEKAALVRPKAHTSRFQVSPIPPNVSPPLIPSVQSHTTSAGCFEDGGILWGALGAWYTRFSRLTEGPVAQLVRALP